MSDVKIRIQGLYKIFGERAAEVLPQVKQGTTKQELLEQQTTYSGCRISI